LELNWRLDRRQEYLIVSTPGDAAHPNASTRVVLVSHASTGATRRAAFPADEPLERPGAILPADPGRKSGFRRGPELRCEQTASGLGWDCVVDPALADMDFGEWRGQDLNDDLSWIVDPTAAPHGGESVADVLERVADWLERLRGTGERVAAVTHPAVVRAALVHVLGAPPQAFWRIDVAPLTTTRLSNTGAYWSLRETGHPVNE
jgi:Histidine phosphatase superfamily (branch 1)